jgi:hypothetical protein
MQMARQRRSTSAAFILASGSLISKRGTTDLRRLGVTLYTEACSAGCKIARSQRKQTRREGLRVTYRFILFTFTCAQLRHHVDDNADQVPFAIRDLAENVKAPGDERLG